MLVMVMSHVVVEAPVSARLLHWLTGGPLGGASASAAPHVVVSSAPVTSTVINNTKTAVAWGLVRGRRSAVPIFPARMNSSLADSSGDDRPRLSTEPGWECEVRSLMKSEAPQADVRGFHSAAYPASLKTNPFQGYALPV